MDWTLSDFVAAGALLVGLGGGVWLALWMGGRHKIVAALAVVAVVAWVWAELAVGVFTTWGS
jgi:hypothetical protein